MEFITADDRVPMGQQLADTAESVLSRVSATLGVDPRQQPTIRVEIYHGADEFAAALPGAGAMAEWAAGIAMPSKRLIMLRIDANTRFTVQDVFLHEVSHVVLARAAGQKHMPRWFVEGVAVHQAGEHILERWRKTAEANLTDALMPLVALEHGFPAGGVRVDLAYAQSTSFEGYLLKLYGWTALRTVIVRVKAGRPFPEALESVFGRSVRVLETEWKSELSATASWIPWITNENLLWVFMVVLFLLAWWRRRTQNRVRLAAMEMPGDEIIDDEFV